MQKNLSQKLSFFACAAKMLCGLFLFRDVIIVMTIRPLRH